MFESRDQISTKHIVPQHGCNIRKYSTAIPLKFLEQQAYLIGCWISMVSLVYIYLPYHIYRAMHVHLVLSMYTVKGAREGGVKTPVSPMLLTPMLLTWQNYSVYTDMIFDVPEARK